MTPTDLEKLSMLYDSAGIEYEFKKREEFNSDLDFFGVKYTETPNVNAIISIKSGWFYSEHWFKDGKLVDYNIFE